LKTSTTHLVLAPNAVVDLQTHTVYSDGTWTPHQLLDYLASEGFGLAAITDHDRVDTAAALQGLALEKHMPLLVAVEMSTSWRGEPTDLLCYGFDPEKSALGDMAQDIMRRQQENTLEILDNLRRKGITLFDEQPDDVKAVLETPSAQQVHSLVALLKKHGYGTPEMSVGKMVLEAGFAFATHDLAAVVEAAHQSGAVCLIAHPGRGDGYTRFDANLLDELRREIPIDGLEVYYPAHTPEQAALYLDYARKHHLLTSSGSDSHAPDKKPIKYRAELSRGLLERVGIQVR
jgi:3',5'-nucleoside bisphosphate phosphatase